MKRKKMISASLICADLGNISECVRDLEKNHIEYLHMDIFDGHFVKNLGFPPEVIKTVRGLTNIPFDFHFCVEEPMNFFNMFDIRVGDYVSIDYNTTKNIYKTLQTIQEIGAKPSISLSPSTSLCVLDYLWDVIDMIMIMTVSPGMAGRKLVPITLEKIKDLRKLLDRKDMDIPIEVDGNVSFVNARLMSQAGANIFVAGTSSIFHKNIKFGDGVRCLRSAINLEK